MISSGINLVMTVIGFAVSTMFIVFVCTRLICARIHLSTSRRSLSTASRADLSILERGIHGLAPVVVASFPTRKFGGTLSQDTQCTVCLGEYQEKDVQRVLPYCGHAFHVHCIDIWLKQHSTCPVCRISLRESPELKRMMTHQPIYGTANIGSFFPPGRNCDPNSFPTEDQRAEPSDDDQLVSEPSGAREEVTAAPATTTELQCDCVSKSSTARGASDESKHLESPSNC